MVGTSFSIKTKIAFITVGFLVALAAFISFSSYKAKLNGFQATFVFPSVEKGQYIIERRNIPNSHIDPVVYYVNEILLGPQTERTERLFPKGTEVLNCFQKNGVLYVDFSKGIVNTERNMLSIKDSIDLFKKNVFSNFATISNVEVYVEGNFAFAEN